MMKTVGTFQTKTHLSAMLEQVALGESFLITKRGKPIASLSPVPAAIRQGPKDTLEAYRKRFAKSLKPITNDEIIEMKNAGRK